MILRILYYSLWMPVRVVWVVFWLAVFLALAYGIPLMIGLSFATPEMLE